jgi:hypothetical protein
MSLCLQRAASLVWPIFLKFESIVGGFLTKKIIRISVSDALLQWCLYCFVQRKNLSSNKGSNLDLSLCGISTYSRRPHRWRVLIKWAMWRRCSVQLLTFALVGGPAAWEFLLRRVWGIIWRHQERLAWNGKIIRWRGWIGEDLEEDGRGLFEEFIPLCTYRDGCVAMANRRITS